VTFVCAASASASISLSIPADNPVLSPGATLATAWAGSCPTSLLCGTWNYTTTDFGAVIATGMLQTAEERNGAALLDAGNEAGDGSSAATTSDFVYPIASYATAGPWYAVGSWHECEPMKPGAINLGTCPLGVSAVLRYRVRTMIGLPREQGSPQLDHHKSGARRALFMRTTFGCNALAGNYVGSLVVHKRVKVRKRWVWVNATVRPRVAATRNDSFAKCFVEYTWLVPRNVARTTLLRYTWSIRSVGMTPAAQAWKRTSKAFAASAACRS